jgi:AcrR family transcriptional regulator
MGRLAGSRNADYQVTRAELLSQLRKVMAAPGGLRLSDRELAAQVSVEPGTLRHYFGNRDGIIHALFILDHGLGATALDLVANGPLGPVYESLRGTLEYIHQGFKFGGLGDVHVVGLGVGLGQKTHGMHYVNELLEPTLQCIEIRIARHQVQGDLAKGSPRHAALQLFSPALMVFLHQYSLGGDGCRPLDIQAFLNQLVADFIRAHQPTKRIHKSRAKGPSRSEPANTGERGPRYGANQANAGQRGRPETAPRSATPSTVASQPTVKKGRAGK